MRICIIGAGVVGKYLAENLSKEGYEIAIIDKDRKKIIPVVENLDVLAVECDVLKDRCIYKLKDFDLFIVATDRDEVNISIALLLRAILKTPKIIVRTKETILSDREIASFLDIEIFDTYNEVITTIDNIIKYPSISSIYEFEDGKLVLFTYKIKKDDFLNGKRLIDLRDIRKTLKFTVALVERNNTKIIPSGSTQLLEGDNIYILLEKNNLHHWLGKFLIRNEIIRNIYILGYSKLGFHIIEHLYNKFNIKVFEPDLKKCEELATRFPKILVLNTSLTDKETLIMEEIGNADLVISPSHREDSILASILSKQLGAKKVMAVIENPEYERIISTLGIDIPIVSRKLIAKRVYRAIRHRRILDSFDLGEEISLKEILVDRELRDKKVHQISKENFIILSLERNGELYLVDGNTQLREGDILLVLERK